MQQPFCPACGAPLRWFPEAYAWGCDRCRQMMPAAQPAMPAQAPAAAPGNRKALLVGGVAIAAIAGIATVAAVAGGGDGSDTGGARYGGSTVRDEPPPRPRPVTPPPPPPEPQPPSDGRPRARARGFSMPIAPGWQEIRPGGKRDNELIVVDTDSGPPGREQVGMFLEITPLPDGFEATRGDGECLQHGTGIARRAGATFVDGKRVATPNGMACQNLIKDDREQRLGMAIVVEGPRLIGATCSFPLGARPPAACVAMIDGITLP